MFCFKCGSSMADTATTCPKCGATVIAPTPSATLGAAAAPAPATSRQAAPPARPYIGVAQNDGKAVGSLILGILAIFPFGLLAGIPAIVLGHLSRNSIRNSLGRLKGEGMALAGLIMGYISVAAIPLILIIAAIAIPSLLRSRMLANEAAAASAVRTVNSAQITYSTKFPNVGYAHDLSTLGPGPAGDCTGEGTLEHACLLDPKLGCSGASCVKTGYRFEVAATCGSDGVCSDYVVTATPVTPGTSGRNSLCSTSDQIIRSQPGGSKPLPQTVAECQSWSPI